MKTKTWMKGLALTGFVVCFLFGSLPAFAKPPGDSPGGFGKGEKKGWGESEVPPGWSHGEKKGWGEGDRPPGFAKKGEEE